jgi:glycyl-tRNA synthetase
MELSGQDMRVYKEYEKPIEKEQLIIKPVMAKLGPAFKKDAAKVADMLSKADPKELVTIKKSGYDMLGKFKILPEYFEIERQKAVERGRRFIPHVVEPSVGSDRLVYVALEYAYHVKDDRALLSFPRDIAPIQVCVNPLVSKDGLPEKALELHKMLLDEDFLVDYDEAGSIGRRYARADEIGVPLSITVDYDTLKDDTVTIRDRDSWKQVRSPIKSLPKLLHDYFRWKVDFDGLGKPFKG